MLQEAEHLATALDDQRRLGQVSAYMSIHFFMLGTYDQAIAAGERALAIATASGDVGSQVVANAYLGFAYHALGDYHWAIDFLRRNITVLVGDLAYERFGQAGLPSVLSHAWLVGCLTEVGAFAEGIRVGEAGVRIAETAHHPLSLIVACESLGRLYLIKGEVSKTIPLLERSLSLCQTASVSVLLPQTAATLGTVYTLLERLPEALPLLELAVRQAASIGMHTA